MPMAYVYNHDDEGDTFTFEGNVYALPGHGGLELPEHIVDHAVAYLGKWGVCKLSKPVKNGNPAPQDIAAFNAALKTYVEATRKWAEDIVLANHRANAPRIAAGLSALNPSDDVLKARKWLEEHPA